MEKKNLGGFLSKSYGEVVFEGERPKYMQRCREKAIWSSSLKAKDLNYMTWV